MTLSQKIKTSIKNSQEKSREIIVRKKSSLLKPFLVILRNYFVREVPLEKRKILLKDA